MLDLIKKRKVVGQPIRFLFAIDATQTPQPMEVSTFNWAIMGGCYSLNNISTVDMDINTVKSVLGLQKRCLLEVVKASEVKVSSMVFQQVMSGLTGNISNMSKYTTYIAIFATTRHTRQHPGTVVGWVICWQHSRDRTNIQFSQQFGP